MKFSITLPLILISVMLIQCKSLSDHINESFNTVESSLEESNKHLGNSLETLYYSIDSNRQKNMSLALKADSLFHETINTCKYMDSLKEAMQIADTSGNDINIATNIFVHSKTGNILKNKLLNIYHLSCSSLVDSSKKKSIDSVFSETQTPTDNTWEKIYFENTPTIAAITMLSKFQNDCKDAALISLEDIKENLAH